MTRVPGVALAVFVLLQGVFALTASGYVFRVPDEYEVYYQTESLWERRSLAVPQTLALGTPDGKSAFFGKRGAFDRQPYAPYGPGAAFLALPHHALARALSSSLAEPARTTVATAITSLATATAGALAAWAFVVAARALGASERRAAGLALVLAFATALWPYATCFYSEAFAAAALGGAAACLLHSRSRASLLGVAAVLLAVATLVKATNVVYAVALAAAPLFARDLAWSTRVRAAAVLVGGVVAAGLVHAQWNASRFGSPFDLGYDWSETIPEPPPRGFGAPLGRGLLVLLASPGKSLLLWAPAIPLLALPRLRAAHAREPALVPTLGLALVLGLALFAKYVFVEGGYCHGPRHLVPIVPLLLLPAACGPRPDRRALLAAILLGVPLNLLATAIAPLEDQAWGLARDRAVYYERVRPEPGLPENRYRLDYVPQVTLPRLAASSVEKILRGDAEAPGTGIDLLPLQLLRMSRIAPEESSALRRIAWGHVLLSLGVAIVGITLLRRALTEEP